MRIFVLIKKVKCYKVKQIAKFMLKLDLCILIYEFHFLCFYQLSTSNQWNCLYRVDARKNKEENLCLRKLKNSARKLDEAKEIIYSLTAVRKH